MTEDKEGWVKVVLAYEWVSVFPSFLSSRCTLFARRLYFNWGYTDEAVQVLVAASTLTELY